VPNSADAPLILDAEHAAFVVGGVSILAASRDPQQLPSIARAHGCRVAADRRLVTVYVARSQSGTLLDDVERCGALAVVFSYPPTHRTIQLKSTRAVVRATVPGETDGVQAYVESFMASVAPFGYEWKQIEMLFAHRDGDLAAVDFPPESAFVQTPGPNAGAPMPR